MPNSLRRASCLLALVLASFAVTEFLMIRSNALSQHPEWISTKSTLARGVFGGNEFYSFRPTLYGNRLHLGYSNGHNEVSYARPVRPSEVTFNFQLGPHAYLIFEYSRTSDGFSGLRISNSQYFSSALLKMGADGGFVSKQLIQNGAGSVVGNGENRFRASFRHGGVDFYLNGHLIAQDPFQPLAMGQIGFRNNYDTADVWNVHIKQASGRSINASFRNTADYWPIFAGVLLLIGIASVILSRRGAATVLAANLILAATFAGASYAALHWPDRLPKSIHGDRPLLYFGPPERDPWIESEKEVVARMRNENQPGDDGKFRIIFLGSSQTWGAGASKDTDPYPMRITARLNSDPEAKRLSAEPYEGIDPGISGALASQVIPHYINEWIHYDPRLVTIDLSNNDGITAPFAQWMEKLAALDTDKKIPTLFILEANDIECPVPNLLPNHQAMLRIAKEYGIPVFDLNAYIAKHSDDGLVWWDNVHMTSFGYHLVAQGLYPEILKLLARIHSVHRHSLRK